jgi:hypothetical protein
MRHVLLVAFIFTALLSFAQQAAQPQSETKPDQTASKPEAQSDQTPKKGCLAVKPIGSHAFRNVMLLGVAGALISHQQYEVVEVIDYPAHVGEKFHGSDLQTISGTSKVVVLDKKYSPEDLQKACQ